MDAQTLGAGDVLTAQRWLEAAEADPSCVPPAFHWHGFAIVAANKAHAAATTGEADAWAAISTRVYERLGSTRGPHWDALEHSGMLVRARMIGRYGAASGHPVRDPRTMVDWFHARATMSLADAHREATQLRARPFEEWSQHRDLMRTLRALKIRIGVFQTLEPVPDELRPWLELWPLLP